MGKPTVDLIFKEAANRMRYPVLLEISEIWNLSAREQLGFDDSFTSD
jgi:hypothetical protein